MKNVHNNYKPFSSDELIALHSMWLERKSFAEIAKTLNRSQRSVETKFNKLFLKHMIVDKNRKYPDITKNKKDLKKELRELNKKRSEIKNKLRLLKK